ncbi:hypothetical protein [Luteimonas deserti]|uniref:Uncharacterized protein n=1 Tax=Luteimonas deserti TaxID=2752306 RepID=A0A7Z0TZ04_9GAMM|nr:hypothetical protein [Luteimonas deserti]NYZ62932.1 hypothetical protein [Luteimonas deserti]
MSKSEPLPPSPHALLGAALLGLLAIGAVVLLSFPGARAGSSVVGWPPLWLVGAPAVAWATLQLLALPRRRGPASSAGPRRRRPGARVQAMRRPAQRRRAGLAARAAMAAAGLLPDPR